MGEKTVEDQEYEAKLTRLEVLSEVGIGYGYGSAYGDERSGIDTCHEQLAQLAPVPWLAYLVESMAEEVLDTGYALPFVKAYVGLARRWCIMKLPDWDQLSRQLGSKLRLQMEATGLQVRTPKVLDLKHALLYDALCIHTDHEFGVELTSYLLEMISDAVAEKENET